jgi:hypothetical protein
MIYSEPIRDAGASWRVDRGALGAGDLPSAIVLGALVLLDAGALINAN